MKHRDFVPQPNHIEQINIELDRNLKQITKLVLKRKQLINLKKSRIEQQFKLHFEALNRGDKQITTQLREIDRDLNNLLTNVQQNPRLRSTVNSMWNQSIANISKAENAKTVQFWNTNKKLESEIDASLKKLKALDINIEGIVGELFNIGRSIDDTDEQIREILSRRYENHIQKAEPFSLERQKLQDSLQAKYQQREKVKEDKVLVIKKLIDLLQNLRAHRQSRMKALFQIEDSDMPVYNQFVEGLEKIVKTRQSLHASDNDDNKLQSALLITEEKSDESINNYLKRQGEQNALLEELTKYFGNKLRIVSLQKALIGDIIPESASKNLPQTIKKCKQFRKILELSSNQKSMVRQGLDKTKSTTSIFQQILKSVESERARRKKLMEGLNELESYYNDVKGKEDKRREMVSQAEQILLRKKQLEKRLNELASKADLDGYKKVTEQMESLKEDEEDIQNKINKVNDSLISGEGNIEEFVAGLNTEYNDILKEIVPQSWMKKHDLRKPENVLELNWYLQKTFERLSL